MTRPAEQPAGQPFDAAEGGALAALLDVLLPGDGTFPRASAIGLAGAVAALALRRDDDLEAVRRLLGDLPAATGDVEAVRAAEAADAARFRRVLELACCAYYADPSVRTVLETRCGYPDRPPQPAGYPTR